MMLDFGAGELVVIGVVALVAIGPKELPGVLRAVGKSVGKLRRMAGDFQNQFSDAMRDMELEEARKKVEEMGKQMSDTVADATKDSAVHIDTYLAETASAAKPVTEPAGTEGTLPPAPDLPHVPEIAAVSSDQILANVEASIAAIPVVPVAPATTPEAQPQLALEIASPAPKSSS